MNRRHAIAAVTLAAALLTSCGKDSSGATSIRLIGEAYAPLEALAGMTGEFEAETGIAVEVVMKDHQSVVAELDQELRIREVTYDVLLMPHRLLGKMVEKGHVLPIDPLLLGDQGELVADLFQPWSDEVSSYGGTAYGRPFTLLTMYLVYRQDLLDDPGEQARFREQHGRDLAPPSNWEEYRDLAAFFTRPDDGLYGTYINGQKHVALWYEWINFVYSFGGNVLDAEAGSSYGDIVVNSPENLAATEYYVSLLEFSPPEARNYNWDDALATMQQGRAFMGLMWHDSTPYLEVAEDSVVAGKMGYAPLFGANGGIVAQLEGWTYLIPAEAEAPEAAARFITWAMGRDEQVRQTLGGGASPRRSVYDDPDVQAIPYMPAFRACLDSGIAKPTVPESGQMTEVMTNRLSEIVSQKLTPADGLDRMAEDLKAVLGDKAALRYPPR